MDFEYFIIDMGILNVYTAAEFSRCQKQFLVGSLCEWKKAHTLEKIRLLFNTTNLHQEYITLLGDGVKKESKLVISSNLSLRVLPIPFIHNPFRFGTELFSFWGKLLATN